MNASQQIERQQRIDDLRALIAAHEEGAERRAARAAKGGLHAEKAAAADAKCAAHRAELAALLGETAPKAAPRFTAELNRRAWAIRREAAARFGVKVTAISWAECLKLARS